MGWLIVCETEWKRAGPLSVSGKQGVVNHPWVWSKLPGEVWVSAVSLLLSGDVGDS